MLAAERRSSAIRKPLAPAFRASVANIHASPMSFTTPFVALPERGALIFSRARSEKALHNMAMKLGNFPVTEYLADRKRTDLAMPGVAWVLKTAGASRAC